MTNGNSKEKYTTLILGAGASQHLKYPLGRELVKDIYKLKGWDYAGMCEILEPAIQKIRDDFTDKQRQKEAETELQKLALEEEKKIAESAKYEVYKKQGLTFLEANKSKEGVKTTESGLQYIVLKQGKGKKPKTTDRVKVHYHGTTIDGTVFDSSVDKGVPSEFGVTQVIKGWTEGLQLMKVGSKYKFFIPQELAYGQNPRPGIIKPYMALIFEVELLDIK